MSLSAPEIASIVIGLGGGYWLVTRILEGMNRPELTPEDFEPRRADTPPPAAEPAGPPWWEVLGVGPGAGDEEIAQAYKRKISEYHPDKVARMGDEIRALAERKSKEINAAYDAARRRAR